MPAGVYRLLGPASENGPTSYAHSDGWAPLTKQDKRPLLCRNCEITLSKAEDWVLRRLPRRGRFPFYDILKNRPPEHCWPGVNVYATTNRPAINADLLSLFAVSIFWRYSVASWPSGDTIQLGPYAEQFRLYLRGAAFPETARLVCMLSRFTAEHTAVMMPNTAKAKGYLLHQFVIPGFDFMLVVGRNAPDAFDKFCLMRSFERPIIVSERSDSRRLDQAVRVMDLADAAQANIAGRRTRR